MECHQSQPRNFFGRGDLCFGTIGTIGTCFGRFDLGISDHQTLHLLDVGKMITFTDPELPVTLECSIDTQCSAR